ncbi:MarR family transcriptional regulator [Pseudomonas sp. R2.Fl]|nr:MarR family transcriptional regulator [Pseudomonas sp. R2.Fl]
MMEHCHCIALRKASRRLTAIYDAALAPFGVNITQFSELRRIRRLQPISLTDLASELELDRSTVGRNAKVLQRMGLVATVEADDRRESALVLTGKARALLDEAATVWDEVQARVEDRFESAGLTRLLEGLEQL